LLLPQAGQSVGGFSPPAYPALPQARHSIG
jgi:hypothetical protein